MGYIGQAPANKAVKTADIEDSAITAAKIADGTVVAGELASDSVTTAKILNANVTTAKLAADAVDGTKIADDAIESEHYANTSIDAGHIASDAVTTAKILNANVTEAKIADNAITLAKMASGTDGNIISYDASGNPVAIATGSSGQVLTSGGAGAAPSFAAAAGGGKILQVTNRNTNSTMYTTSSSLTATDMYGAITPSATSSKILVMMHFRFGSARGATSTGAAAGYGIHRDIGGAGYSIVQPSNDGITYNMWATTYDSASEPVVYHKYHPSLIFVDSPNTTSAVTYKLYVKTAGGTPGITVYFGGNHNSDHTTLLEIDGS